MKTSSSYSLMVVLACLLPCAPLYGQGTLADYQRAQDLRAKATDLVVNVPGPAHWIGEEHRFWYAKTVKGGNDYVLADADAATKKPAFDQTNLASSISQVTGHSYTSPTLPSPPPPPPRSAKPYPSSNNKT